MHRQLYTGATFSRWTVLEDQGDPRRRAKVLCECQCGTQRAVDLGNLLTGKSRSCGCWQREGVVARSKQRATHGHATVDAKSPTYQSWRGMRARCTQTANAQYRKYYIDRGITVCERWKSFENFLEDMGERPEGRTLDRIDVDGNYEPSNCRWATPKEQRANRRDGVAASLLLALLALAVLALLPASAHALELGVQDDGRQSSAVAQDADALGGSWTRTIAYIGQPGVAQRIRDAHTAGLQIILTVGGTGTQTRKPSFTQALRYISSLPRADRYTIDNEPDLDGVKACTYRKGWMKARRRLGRRLLWGDTSPHAPLTFTAAARRCGPLPKTLDFALHPYQSTDPLAHSDAEGGLGNLGYMKRWLKKNVGVRVTWWLTEFGYIHQQDQHWTVTDAQAAWLWPRAIRQATRNHARVLIAYTAQGQSWDTRPGPLSWCSMTLGRACPGAVAPEDHREPVKHVIRQVDPVLQQMLAYASNT